MQIFVDADACPVVGIIEKIVKEHYLTMKKTASDCITLNGHCNKQCPFKVMQMERMSKIREYFGK